MIILVKALILYYGLYMSMNVKGEVLRSLPLFVIKRFGQTKYMKWLNTISSSAHTVYSEGIDDKEWYPLTSTLVAPTVTMCDMFYRGSMRGAWECGRYSADYGLKGIYKVLVKLQSPTILIQKSSSIFSSLYQPASLQVTVEDERRLSVVITEFEEIHSVIEARIGGWMERALEISGCKHVNISIEKSLADHDHSTDYKITWQKRLL